MSVKISKLFLTFIAFLTLWNTGCNKKNITKAKDISYSNSGSTKELLNIYSPKNAKQLSEVIVIIHGGNWNSGSKSLYSFLGKRFAKKGVVAVIIGYPYSPAADYHQMATSCAKAVRWVKDNIDKFGGDPNKIFVSGHSAGGHLAALISVKSFYFDSLNIDNPIKGVILIDAAGLDMYGYLKKEKLPNTHHYYKAFGVDSNVWKEATPLYHLSTNMPPFLIFMGEKTYPSIKESNKKFLEQMKKFVEKPHFKTLDNKKHVAMITQFFNLKNPIYDEILTFMRRGM